jgi:hypothetical protein
MRQCLSYFFLVFHIAIISQSEESAVGNSFSNQPREITLMNNIQSPKFSSLHFDGGLPSLSFWLLSVFLVLMLRKTLSADIIVYVDTSAAVVALFKPRRKVKASSW